MTGIELVETLDGSPAEVWPVVSDPEILGEWLDDEVELTLRVGAPIRTRGDDGARAGVVDDVQIGRRLAFTWAPVAPNSGPVTTVELDLECDPDGAHTVLRIRERIVDASIDLDAFGGNGADFRALARC
jgi:uncharacterized protein YndB with AHSA1/START domain